MSHHMGNNTNLPVADAVTSPQKVGRYSPPGLILASFTMDTPSDPPASVFLSLAQSDVQGLATCSWCGAAVAVGADGQQLAFWAHKTFHEGDIGASNTMRALVDEVKRLLGLMEEEALRRDIDYAVTSLRELLVKWNR